MLSALPAAQHVPFTLHSGPPYSYDLPSSLLSVTPRSSSLAMHGKSLSTFASSSTPLSTSRPSVTSPGRMFRIFGFSPQEGSAGTSIVVNVHFSLLRSETTFLRIVVGNRALSTVVRPAQSEQENEWELEAIVPDLTPASTDASASSSTVPVTVQALNRSNVTLDSLTFGRFTYTRRAVPSPLLLCKQEVTDDFALGSLSAASTPDARHAHSSPYPSPLLARKASRPTPASGTARARALNATMVAKDAQSARGQLKKQSLMRARRSSSDDDDADNNFRVVLQLEMPTDPMSDIEEWDEEERRIGRRLVRFTRIQDGCTLHVTCEAIRPSDYTDGDTVVSCIYRPSEAVVPGELLASQCCITSVDIIFLLECLVGDIFNIEEKNRIRRNLEGFRPKTVSKNKVGSEEFFQKIMDFPAPKPRNIEKDVKVFDWAVLPQALEKIISKYTLYPAVKKEGGNITPPIPESTSMPPHVPQASANSPYTASPTPDHTPSASPQQSYFYYQPIYHSPQYASTPLDALDSNNSYAAATALSCAGSYDAFLAHAQPHSGASSPMPMLSTSGARSPMPSDSASMAYPDSSQSLYQQHPYRGQSPYSSNNVYMTPFHVDHERMRMSSSPHGSQPFL
ncbi:hypothetical protein DICSQDRAFT_140019 [Dichomitus squalens LYAD-421 SS1]|uniref:DUF7082 domain-containing protein n=1 Tax=Dichomitus squalens (strain LYAD-421) TaxID=732165 RepID=R7SPA1_DICSQ|nr:uncharacterized protein DICSQDRAFT_140019 [Dichomitus squalens LYAD-421 SS1]EJF57733.1 hypothetical protein DICSQDRAFT_140019 [Dichomitus squalens LYAD-421 SS1]